MGLVCVYVLLTNGISFVDALLTNGICLCLCIVN